MTKDQTSNFVLQRYVNLSGAAEGAQLPPRLVGNVRVPPPSRFEVTSSVVTSSGTSFSLRWQDVSQSRIPNVDHYVIYATGISNNKDPVQVGSASSSPCTVMINATDAAPILTFYIQTVLGSGLHSKLSDSPTCTAGLTPHS